MVAGIDGHMVEGQGFKCEPALAIGVAVLGGHFSLPLRTPIWLLGCLWHVAVLDGRQK